MIFSYRARNRIGELSKGTIEASDIHKAASKIRTQGLWVIDLIEKESPDDARSFRRATKSDLPHKLGSAQAPSLTGMIRQSLSPLGRKEAVLFCQQLYTLFTSGLPVHEALEAIASTKDKTSYIKMVKDIQSEVLRGLPLSDALLAYPDVFPAMAVHLIRSGEHGGALDKVLENLSAFLSQDYKAREDFKNIMLYPAALFLITCLSVIFMTLFVMPAMASILAEMDVPLPLPTAILLRTSSFLSAHLVAAAIIACLVSMSCFFLYHDRKSQQTIDRFTLHIPILGNLYLYSDWHIVLETLAILLESGMTLAESLEIVVNIPRNHALQTVLETVSREVSEGENLSHSLKKTDLFPTLLISMVTAGEASGEMDIMLKQASSFCHTTAKNISVRMESLAEPVMMLIIGSIIFFFVLSIILPLLDTMDTFI